MRAQEKKEKEKGNPRKENENVHKIDKTDRIENEAICSKTPLNLCEILGIIKMGTVSFYSLLEI